MLSTNKKPILPYVPSVEFQGCRVRALWSTIFMRPLAETFHEFLVHVLTLTFGIEWLNQQNAMVQKHIVAQWLIAWEQFRQANRIPGQEVSNSDFERWNVLPSGEVKALVQLAYDLFCLQAVDKLPDFMIKKLRDMHEFQGVRYEIAVAAIIARANFDIIFLDDIVKDKKHCEFIAIHKILKFEIGVEAKSRRRPGILHETGTFDPSKNASTDVRKLFHKALTQKPDALPFMIFIDLNLPPLDRSLNENDLLFVDEHNQCTSASPDDYNAFFLTNFSHYYLRNHVVAKGQPVTAIVPLYSRITCDPTVIADVWESVRNYEYIPVQI